MGGPEIAKLTNVRIHDLVRIGERTVRDMVVVGSDEGVMILDRLTGELYEVEPQPLYVEGELFRLSGPAAVILGYGRDRRSGGLIPGEGRIVTEDTEFRVVFAVEGFCVATMHESAGLEDSGVDPLPEGVNALDSFMPTSLLELARPLVSFHVEGHLDSQGRFSRPSRKPSVIVAEGVRVYELAEIGGKPARGKVLVVAAEGGMVVDRTTGYAEGPLAASYEVHGHLFDRNEELAIILGFGLSPEGGGLRPGDSSLSTDDHTFKVVFALEGFCIATIHAPRGR